MIDTGLSGASRDVSRTLRMSEIWTYLAIDDVVARYKRTMLGPLWNAAYMIATAIGFAIVFGGLFGQPLDRVLPYIVAGFIVWNFGPLSVIDASVLFSQFSAQIRFTNLPYFFYVMRHMTRALIFLVHNLLVFWIMMLLLRLPIWVHWSFIPALLLVLIAVVPYVMMMAMITARFRDIQMLVQSFSGVLFFITPVLWNAEYLQGWRSAIVVYNPLYYVVDIVRRPLLNQVPPMQDWIALLSIIVVGYVLCAITFSAFRRRIPFWI